MNDEYKPHITQNTQKGIYDLGLFLLLKLLKTVLNQCKFVKPVAK